MKIAVFADEEQWKEICLCSSKVEWVLLENFEIIPESAEAIFILKKHYNFKMASTNLPIFLNAVSITLAEINAPLNVLRINGWKGFLLRPDWEIAGLVTKRIENILSTIGKQFTKVPDLPGFIAARVVAMIINEAWYAFEEQISSKDEIDIALKLGTGYPFGPFEWGEIIGEHKIYDLLQKLSIQDKKYLPAVLLHQKISK